VSQDWIADAVLLVHFGFVGFVVGGLALIWTGAWLDWHWVRNFRFRVVHLAAIGFVAFEAIIGMACPLTEWEYALRGKGAEGPTFIERLLAPLIFYHLPPWAFTLLHVGFALLVALTFWLVPPLPRIPRKENGNG
jgi:Protein of Unknown function (DUF2784)